MLLVDDFRVEPNQHLAGFDDRSCRDHISNRAETSNLALDFGVVRTFKRPLFGNSHDEIAARDSIGQLRSDLFGLNNRREIGSSNAYYGEYAQHEIMLWAPARWSWTAARSRILSALRLTLSTELFWRFW